MDFHNTYEDTCRAAAYAELELGGTYHLAFRDLPDLLQEQAAGTRAVDFGCGTGRSTRFLQRLGFETTGVDISEAMVSHALGIDPAGDYRVIADGDFADLPQGGFDLVQSAFTFDNIPGHARRVLIMGGLRELLDEAGVLLNIVSTPAIYTHEWATFSTRDYPENRLAQSGDIVRIVTTDYSDGRPVEDVLWRHKDYLRLYNEAGFEVVRFERPLASGEEAVAWKSETRVAPWSLYLLRRRPSRSIATG